MAREHIRAFQDLPNVCVSGIFSRTKARSEALATEFNIPLVCQSLSELNERTGAQLGVVTVSAESMRAVACECFGFGWNLLLEKPPGYNLDEAEVIQTAASKSSRKVWVALNRRFMSSTRSALADLHKRPGPRHIQVLDQLDPILTASFGHPSEIIENLMFFSSIHAIDYLRVFGRGAVRSVRPVFEWSTSNPWIIAAAVDFEGGDTALYQALWNAPGPWAVSVNTTEVRWEMRPLERAAYQLAGQRSSIEVPQSDLDKKFKAGFRLQAEQVVDAVLGKPSEVPTLDEAMHTMHLIGKLYGLSSKKR